MTAPTRYALVPVDPDLEAAEEMIYAFAAVDQILTATIQDKVSAYIAASPGGGAVTQAQRRAAARAIREADGICEDENCQQCLEAADAAIAALGLTVADAREEAGNG